MVHRDESTEDAGGKREEARGKRQGKANSK